MEGEIAEDQECGEQAALLVNPNGRLVGLESGGVAFDRLSAPAGRCAMVT